MSVGAVNKSTGDRIPTAGMPAIDDALSLISTNPVQNAIITAALADKQDKTDNNLQTTDKTVVGAVNELKSGLTNVQDAVKLNTQDLTTPSRSINLMTLPITITKSGGSTGTVTNNNGVITLDGEFLNNETITITCANCIVPNDAIIAYMNNVALPSANISFYNGSTKHDYFSFSIPNRIIYTSALVNVVGKTINKYEINFAADTTVDNFSFSLMMVHSGQNVSSYAPYIPSVESRIESVESGLVKITKESFEQITVNAGSKKFVTNVGLLTDNVVVTAYSDNSDVIAYVATATTTYQVYLYNPTNAAITSNITVMVAKV